MSRTSARVQRNIDFFRSTTGNALPNGINDHTEGVSHDGVLHLGNASGSFRSEHFALINYEGNGTFQSQVIQTTIPMNSTIMPSVKIKGYGYGDSNIIDFDLGFYTYNLPLNSLLNVVGVNQGSIRPTVKLGNIGGFVAIELVWNTPKYFYRYIADAICLGNSSAQSDAFFENWIISNSDFATLAATDIVIVNFKTAPASNNGGRYTVNLNSGTTVITHNLNLTDPRVMIDARLASDGSRVDVLVVPGTETVNTVTISTPISLPNVSISIIPLTL